MSGIFILNFRKLIAIIALWLLLITMHNLVSGYTGREDMIFFFLAVVVMPFYMTVSIWTTIVDKVRRWKILKKQ